MTVSDETLERRSIEAEAEVERRIGFGFRHVKTGGLYVYSLVAFRESDLATLVVYYRSGSAALTFARPLEEMLDGRFVPAD